MERPAVVTAVDAVGREGPIGRGKIRAWNSLSSYIDVAIRNGWYRKLRCGVDLIQDLIAAVLAVVAAVDFPRSQSVKGVEDAVLCNRKPVAVSWGISESSCRWHVSSVGPNHPDQGITGGLAVGCNCRGDTIGAGRGEARSGTKRDPELYDSSKLSPSAARKELPIVVLVLDQRVLIQGRNPNVRSIKRDGSIANSNLTESAAAPRRDPHVDSIEGDAQGL